MINEGPSPEAVPLEATDERRSRPRWIAGAVVVVVIAVAIAASGLLDGTGSVDILDTAASSLDAAETFRMETRVRESVTDGETDELTRTTTMTWVVDLAREASAVTIHFELRGGESLTGEERRVGDWRYKRSAQDDRVPADTWIRVPAGHDVPARQFQDLLDPTAFLGRLADVATVEDQGSGEVRGVPVTLYTTTLSRAELADASAQEVPEELAQHVDDERMAKEQVSIELAIDEDGLLRRLVQSRERAASALSEPGRIITTTELFDFGVRVDIQAPPEHEVVDLEDISRGAGD